MRNQIVILAAGQGKRMGGHIPKVLVALKGKPLILYMLETLLDVPRFIKPVVVVGYMGDKVKEFLGDDYTFAYQPKQQGTANALLSARWKIKAKNVLVLYGDQPFLSAQSLKKLMSLHQKKEAKISLCTSVVPNFKGVFKNLQHAGRIVRHSNGDIEKIIEDKDANSKEKKIKEINTGIYMFNTDWLWKNIKKINNLNAQGEYYLTDIVKVAIEQGQRVYFLSINSKEVIGVNNKEELRVAEALV